MLKGPVFTTGQKYECEIYAKYSKIISRELFVHGMTSANVFPFIDVSGKVLLISYACGVFL